MDSGDRLPDLRASTQYQDVITVVERLLRHTFKDKTLIVRALTLPTSQQDYRKNYKSLEYVGDGE